MKYKNITDFLCAALIALFVYASLSKLLAYPTFARQLHTHPLLKPYAGFLAWAVPAAELGIVTLLIIPATRLAGLYSAAGLLAVFTIYITAMLLSDQPLPCACGGIISGLQWKGHLVFNLLFLLIAIVGSRIERKQGSDASRISSPVYPASRV